DREFAEDGRRGAGDPARAPGSRRRPRGRVSDRPGSHDAIPTVIAREPPRERPGNASGRSAVIRRREGGRIGGGERRKPARAWQIDIVIPCASPTRPDRSRQPNGGATA